MHSVHGHLYPHTCTVCSHVFTLMWRFNYVHNQWLVVLPPKKSTLFCIWYNLLFISPSSQLSTPIKAPCHVGRGSKMHTGPSSRLILGHAWRVGGRLRIAWRKGHWVRQICHKVHLQKWTVIKEWQEVGGLGQTRFIKVHNCRVGWSSGMRGRCGNRSQQSRHVIYNIAMPCSRLWTHRHSWLMDKA